MAGSAQHEPRDFQAVLDAVRWACFVLDEDMRITALNRAAAELGGSTGEALLGEPFTNVLGSSDAIGLIHRVMDERKRVEAEVYDPRLNSWLLLDGTTLNDHVVLTAIDAEEHRRTREKLNRLVGELRRERTFLDAVVEQMPSGLSIAEAPSGRLLRHNETAVRLLGHPHLPSETYEGYRQYGALHEDGRSYDESEYPIARALLQGETVTQHEMRYRRGDGSITTLSINAAPIRDEGGKIIAAVSTFHDIQSRKKAEEDLRRAHRRIAEILESIDDGFYALDREWRFTYVNRRAEELWGRSRDELIGNILWEELPELAGQEKEVEAFHTAMNQRRAIYFDILSPVLHRWLDISVYPTESGISIYFRDVTQRKSVEEQLRCSQEQYELLFDANPRAMLVYDASSAEILKCNTALLELCGYSEDALLAFTLFDLAADSSEGAATFVPTGREAAHFGTWRLRRRDDTIIEVEMASHALELDDRLVRLAVIDDVTERNQTSRENRRRREELTILLGLSRTLAGSTGDRRQVPAACAEAALQAVAAGNAAIVWLRDDESHVMTVAACTGVEVDSALLSLPTHHRLFLKQEVSASDLLEFPNDHARTVLSELVGDGHLLIATSLDKTEPVGVLVVRAAEKDLPFDERDIHMLRSVLAQTVIAASNAQLVEELRRMSHRLVRTEETERRRIAQEMHDEVGASLASLQVGLQMIADVSPAAQETLTELRETVSELVERVRNLSMTLRPSILDDLGLIPAILTLAERWRTTSGITVNVNNNIAPSRRLPPSQETNIYRIIQEALTNAVRHAHARRIDVILFGRNEELVLNVIDDGVGFDADTVPKGLGLEGMRQRATVLNGSLTIESAPGQGTRITTRLPTNIEDDR